MNKPPVGELEQTRERGGSHPPIEEPSFLEDPEISARAKLEHLAKFAESKEGPGNTGTSEAIDYTLAESHERQETFERITEEPTNETLLDESMPSVKDIMLATDSENTRRENQEIADMLAKFPEHQRNVFDASDGIE